MEIEESASLDKPWARTLPGRVTRELLICGVFGSIIDAYSHREIVGREYLEPLEGPVIFVANHCSHVDTPMLLGSLPARWRGRTAVVAAADYFYTKRLLANAVSPVFCTVPMERGARGRGTDATTDLEHLIDTGWNLIVFAEGRAHATAAWDSCARAPRCWPPGRVCRSCRPRVWDPRGDAARAQLDGPP